MVDPVWMLCVFVRTPDGYQSVKVSLISSLFFCHLQPLFSFCFPSNLSSFFPPTSLPFPSNLIISFPTYSSSSPTYSSFSCPTYSSFFSLLFFFSNFFFFLSYLLLPSNLSCSPSLQSLFFFFPSISPLFLIAIARVMKVARVHSTASEPAQLAAQSAAAAAGGLALCLPCHPAWA